MAMKSTSHGTVSWRIRSAMKKTAPLRTPTSTQSGPAWSVEISSPSSATRSRRDSSSTSTSAMACSSSVCDTLSRHPFRLDEARDRDDLVPAHDERPGLPLRARDLRVHEDVLDLLAAPRQPVSGSPSTYLKAPLVRCDAPVAPADLAIEGHGRALEPHLVVLADDLPAPAEVEPRRAVDGLEELDELRRGGLAVGQPEQIALGGRVELPEEREDLEIGRASCRERGG